MGSSHSPESLPALYLCRRSTDSPRTMPRSLGAARSVSVDPSLQDSPIVSCVFCCLSLDARLCPPTKSSPPHAWIYLRNATIAKSESLMVTRNQPAATTPAVATLERSVGLASQPDLNILLSIFVGAPFTAKASCCPEYPNTGNPQRGAIPPRHRQVSVTNRLRQVLL